MTHLRRVPGLQCDDGNAPFGQNTDIYFAHTDKQGLTWTIRPVHLPASGKYYFWPFVSVGKSGEVRGGMSHGPRPLPTTQRNHSGPKEGADEKDLIKSLQEERVIREKREVSPPRRKAATRRTYAEFARPPFANTPRFGGELR